MLPVKFLACCKTFVEFQIDLFIKDSTFSLRKINCNFDWTRTDYENDVSGHDYTDDS